MSQAALLLLGGGMAAAAEGSLPGVAKTPDLRSLSLACCAFNGVQSVFTAYFVTYLVALGYELAAAGFLFSIVVAVAVPCRVLWAGLGVSTWRRVW